MERFWSKVERRAPDECWPWQASTFGNGYGAFWFDGKMTTAHRIAFFLAHGRYPENGCHECDNPPCCNPAHIFDGTSLDNSKDRQRKGRTCGAPPGERHRGATMTDVQVCALRQQARGGASLVALSQTTGIPHSTLHAAVAGDSWKHLACPPFRKRSSP